MVQDVLTYLTEIGWSELIDSKWEGDVIRDILEAFPDILEDDLSEVLSIVII